MKPIIAYRRENKIDPTPLEDVMLRGEIGARVDRFIHERVSGDFAVGEILREAEECFAEQYDDEFEWGMWRCEFWGKLMISAVRCCRLKNDAALKEKLRASAYRVLAFQREDGSLSTYRRSDNLFRVTDFTNVLRDAGWMCYYNWNVWGCKYTLWGLLECAELTGDGHLLACAGKLADSLLSVLERLGRRMKDCGVMSGMPACSILKPLLLLYRLTGREAYYRAALGIAAEWDRADNEAPNLIANALSGRSAAGWYETGSAPDSWIAKAYEMMSCFDGLCELYRLNGDERLLDAVKAQYAMLKEHEGNLLGSTGYCERFAEAASQPNAATEICDVIHWMRLSHELFCLTGEARYMEDFENAFLNAFLAGMYADGRGGAFFVRSSGRHWDAEPQVETKYQHCCLNNLPRGFCNMAESVVMQGKDALYVNSYIPFRAVFGGADLKIGNGYLDSGRVALTIRGMTAGRKLMLRVPEWSAATEIRLGDTLYPAKAGEYTAVELPEGDSVVYLRFDMTPRIGESAGEIADLPKTDYHILRWTDGGRDLCGEDCMMRKPMCTLRRGALLFARTRRLGANEAELFGGRTLRGRNASCRAELLSRHAGMLCACRMHFTPGEGEPCSLLMCDFASAAGSSLDEPRYFSIFI